MANEREIIIGIDLGTTFSLVAYADERGPQIIRDERGEGRLPSVLRFAPDGRVTVGWEAREHAAEHPRDTVYSIKRLMGIGIEDLTRELPFLPYHVGERNVKTSKRQNANMEQGVDEEGDGRDVVAVEINGQWLTPQEISALILQELKRRAEAFFSRPVRKAVITVPAYFDDSQRQATRDAGRIAGLEVVRIINEPTAAALAYGLGIRSDEASRRGDRRSDEGALGGDHTIAVYDLGGGTFDVSILRLESGVFEVLSTSGDTHLGGDDFDREIMLLVQREVKERFGVEIASPQTRQAMRLLAEQVKIRLSDEDQAEIELDLGRDRVFRRTLKRSEFESLIAPQIDRTVAACRQAVAAAKLPVDAVDRVVLVGGSSRIPVVRRHVAEFFGKSPYTALNPDEVVALGAAVQGQILSGQRRGLLLLDVTPLSLGIETLGGAMGKLIMANTRVPCRATEMFTTFVDGQANVKIRVLQGERELAKDCRVLGEFDLRGVPPMPAGLPKIEVTFLIDANGILNVSAREQRSGQEASIQVVPAHGLTEDEVKQMTQDAFRFAREDMTAHRLIDLRNQVEFDTHKTEQMLARVGDRLPQDVRMQIEEGVRVLRQLATTSGEADKIQQALAAFDRQTVRLAELAIAAVFED